MWTLQKREIIELYVDDFLKIYPSGKVSYLFSSIPVELFKNTSRYQVTSVLGQSEAKETLAEYLTDLEDCLTVNIAHHADDPNVGMLKTYKKMETPYFFPQSWHYFCKTHLYYP